MSPEIVSELRALTAPCPYVGPRPFDEDDRDFFFGRNRETADLSALILAHSDSLLHSQSGAGKTSLLQAGVMPFLRDVEGCEVLLARVQGSIEGPAPESIANVYVFQVIRTWSGGAVDPATLTTTTLAEYLKGRPRKTEIGSLSVPRVIIFDQFEELFTTQAQYWPHRRDFFVQVSAALKADPQLHVLFAMRDEYIAMIEANAILLPEHLRARMHLERLKGKHALAAIRKPLEKTPCRYAPEVPEAILDDLSHVVTADGTRHLVEDGYIEPVQLQVVCRYLWRKLRPGETEITLAHLKGAANVTSNVTQALGQYYEDAITDVTRSGALHSSVALRQWLEDKLITPQGTRGMVVDGDGTIGGMPPKAIDVLQKSYILRRETRGLSGWYELTHDRLIGPIREANRRWKQEHFLQDVCYRAWNHRFFWPGAMLACLLVLLIAGAIASYRKIQRDNARQTVELHVNEAIQRLGANDQTAAIAYFTEALDHATKAGAADADVQRLRLGVLFERMPPTRLFWSTAFRSKPQQDKPPDDRKVAYAKMAPDGGRVAAAVNNKTADAGELWLLELDKTPDEPFVNEAETKFNSVDFATGGRYLLIASEGRNTRLHRGEIRVWSLAESRIVASLPCSGPVLHAAWSTDRNVIAFVTKEPGSVGKLHAIEFDETGGGRFLKAREVKNYAELDSCKVSFMPNRHVVIVASKASEKDGVIEAIDLAEKDQILFVQKKPANFVALNPDGRRFVSCESSLARVFGWAASDDADNGDKEPLRLRHESTVNFAAFSPDGRFVATASRDTCVRIWDLASGELVIPRLNLDGTVGSVDFSADGRHLLAAGHTSVAVWDVAKIYGHATKHLNTEGWASTELGHGIDGSFLVESWRTKDREFVCQLWDAERGQAVGNPQKMPRGPVVMAKVAKKAQLAVLVLGDGYPKEVVAWEYGPKDAVRSMGTLHNVLDVAIDPAASQDPLVVIVSEEKEAAAHVTAWRPCSKLTSLWAWPSSADKKNPVGVAAKVVFAPTGARLAVITRMANNSGKAYLLDAGKGTTQDKALPHAEAILGANFNHDGTRLVTASADDTAVIWNLQQNPATGMRLRYHTADVAHAEFSPGGTHVVTASPDRTAVVWDLQGRQLAVLHHDAIVQRARFDQTETNVVTVTDHALRVWSVQGLSPRKGQRANLVGMYHIPDPITHDAFFAGDGKRLITIHRHRLEWRDPEKENDWPIAFLDGPDNEVNRLYREFVRVKSWDFRPDERPVDQLRENARRLSGRSFEEERLIPHKWQASDGAKESMAAKSQPHADDRAWLLQQAKACLKLRDWSAAAWNLDRLLPLEAGIAKAQDAPSLRSLHEEILTAHASQGDWQKVKTIADHALKLWDDDWRFLNRRSQAYLHLNQWSSARDDLDKILALNKAESLGLEEWRLLCFRGQQNQDAGLSEDAIQDYDAALSLMPTLFPVWWEKAKLSHAKQDWEEAIKGYVKALAFLDEKKATSKNPERIKLHKAALEAKERRATLLTTGANTFADQARRQQLAEENLPHLDAIVTLSGGEWQYWEKRGDIRATSEDSSKQEGAVEDYLEAFRISKKLSGGKGGLADSVRDFRIIQKAEKLRDAIEAKSLKTQRVGVRNEIEHEVQREYFMQLVAMSNYTGADAYHGKLIESVKNDRGILAGLAKVNAARGKWNEAIWLYKQLKDLNQDAELLFQCSAVYADRGFLGMQHYHDPKLTSPRPALPDVRKDWAASAAYLSAALKLDAKLDRRLDVRHRLVIAQLAADDLQGYQATCQDIAKKFSNPDPVTANSIAWLSVLGPQAGLPGAKLQQLAQTAVRNRQGAQYLNTLGAAYFRTGDYPKALKTLADSRKAYGVQLNRATDEGSETDKLFLALTLEKLDHPEIARVWLDRVQDTPLSRYSGDTFAPIPPWRIPMERYLLRMQMKSVNN